MVYTCKRCLYTTDLKHCLRAHLSRKNKCIVAPTGQDIDTMILYTELGVVQVKTYDRMCEFCKNKYSCAASLSRHRKTCIHDNIIVNNNIQIYSHGHENIDYIQSDNNFLTKCLLDVTNTGIIQFIKCIHLNPEHPENQNIRGRSRRQGIMEIYDGMRWFITPVNTVLDDLIQNICKLLYNHFLKNMKKEFENREDLEMLIDKNIRDLSDLTKARRSETYYKIRKNVFYMFFQDH